MNNLEQLCIHLLKDLKEYNHTNKEDLLLKYINERLDKSFETYQEELQTGFEYLKRRNELNVIRKLNRLK